MGAGQRVGPQVASGLRGFPSTPLELSNSALSVLLSSSARLTSSCPAPQPRVEITGRALELPSGTTAPCQKASQGSPMLRVAQPLLSCFDVYVDWYNIGLFYALDVKPRRGMRLGFIHLSHSYVTLFFKRLSLGSASSYLGVGVELFCRFDFCQ